MLVQDGADLKKLLILKRADLTGANLEDAILRTK